MGKKEELVKTLLEAKRLYYLGQPIMSDDDFDQLEEKLKSIDPGNPYFDVIGYNIPDKEGYVDHHIPMFSMGKLDKNKNIESWYKSNRIDISTNIVLEPKIDGVSCELVYIDGILAYGLTRGDGRKGKLISFIGETDNPTIPKRINTMGIVSIRGELYIPIKYSKTVFKDIPLRNACAGLVNSGEKSEYIKFIAYKHISVDGKVKFKTEVDMLYCLKGLKFNTIPFKIVHSPDEVRNHVNDYISHLREKYEYETDGVVLTINDKRLQEVVNSRKTIRRHNHFNIAIKPPTKVYKSKILDVELNVSKNGRIIPVAIYEPTLIDNVSYERATLNNYSYMEAFGKYYVGNTIYIIRTNDVIPKIVGMDEDGDKTKPINIFKDKCPSCGKRAIRIGKNLVCKNVNCPGKVISSIYNWVVKMNMKNIGIKFLQTAYKKGIIKSIPDLYDKDLANKIGQLEGFVPGGSKVNKIISAIERSKENVSDIDILNAIGIPGIGRAVLENVGLTNIDTLPDDVRRSRSDLAIYRYISDWLTTPKNYAFLLNLKKILGSKPYKVAVKKGPKICITGSFDKDRKDIAKLLSDKGYVVTNQVSKDTNFLLVGEKPGESKLNKAKSLDNVKIVSLNDVI